MITQSKVPAGSGLGGSSALAVAVAAAAARATGRAIEPDALWPIVRDAEARCLGVPTGVQDYHAALHGGVLALHLEAGRVRVERLRTDPARVEECLLLVDAGATRFSGINNWEVFKGQIDGDARVRESLADDRGPRGPGPGSARRGALRRRDRPRGPGVGGPQAAGPRRDDPGDRPHRGGGAARAGGRPRSAGRGGEVWSRSGSPPGERGPGGREAVTAALKDAGFRTFPARVDLRGLEVEEIRSYNDEFERGNGNDSGDAAQARAWSSSTTTSSTACVETQHKTPGQPARVRAGQDPEPQERLHQVEHRFRSVDMVERAILDETEMEFLYQDGDMYHFMNNETFEQIGLSRRGAGRRRRRISSPTSSSRSRCTRGGRWGSSCP